MRLPSDISLHLAFISLAASAIDAMLVSGPARRYSGISSLAMQYPVHTVTDAKAHAMRGTCI